jgi:hypothetical protein
MPTLSEQFYDPKAAHRALAKKTRMDARINLALGAAIASVYAAQNGCECKPLKELKAAKRRVTTVTVTVEELF